MKTSTSKPKREITLELTEVEMDEIEKKSNNAIKEVKETLETYQKSKPPSEPEELVAYLIKRLESGEKSIQIQQQVIL